MKCLPIQASAKTLFSNHEINSPRDRTQPSDKDDEEPSFAHDVRHTCVVQIVTLVLLGPSSAPVFKGDEVADLQQEISAPTGDSQTRRNHFAKEGTYYKSRRQCWL